MVAIIINGMIFKLKYCILLMNTTNILFITVFAILILFFIQKHVEGFYIEPNTVIGGAMPQSGMMVAQDGQYQYYNAPLELEGPGNDAWSGY
jgi:hypothetical protein